MLSGYTWAIGSAWANNWPSKKIFIGAPQHLHGESSYLGLGAFHMGMGPLHGGGKPLTRRGLTQGALTREWESFANKGVSHGEWGSSHIEMDVVQGWASRMGMGGL